MQHVYARRWRFVPDCLLTLGCSALMLTLPVAAPAVASTSTPGIEPNALAAGGASVGGGNAGDGSLVLEEVIVTAQKRAQDAQEIPVAIGVISGDALSNMSVTSTADLDNYVPGLVIQQVPGNMSSITVRGLGTASGNESFDQSVSLFVDGVYAGRQREFSASLFDVERIEVIKGTQNNLLGKNTSLGAISLITKEPGETLGGYVSAEHEFEYGSNSGTAAMDIPATDKLRLRIAGNWVDQNGYIENVATGNDVPELEQKTARIKAIYQFTDTIDAHLMLQHDDLDVLGDTFQPTKDSSGAMLAMDPARDLVLDDRKSSYVSLGKDGESYEEQQADRAAVTVNLDLNGYIVTSLTGYSSYDDVYVNDGDFSAGDYLISKVDSEFEQTTQELRLTSPIEKDGNFMVGIFVLGSSFSRTNPIYADYPAGLHAQLPAVTGDVTNHFDQDTFAASLFGQSTWNITDAQHLTIGMRYTHETKEALLMRTAAVPTLFSAMVYPTFELTSLDRGENSLDGSINYQVDLDDEKLVYAAWGKGTKSGGFSESTTDVTDAEFDAEIARTAEIGTKMKLFDGRARLNAALFRTEIDNFQLVFFNGLGFTTETLPAVSKGVEFDGMVLLTQNLSLAGGMTYADVKNPDNGEAMARAPKKTGNLALNYERNITDFLVGSASFSMNYRDEMYHEMSEIALADAVTRYDLRIGLSDADRHWEVALLGKNITDEKASSFGFNAPIVLDSSVQIESIEAPRTYALQAKYNFQ